MRRTRNIYWRVVTLKKLYSIESKSINSRLSLFVKNKNILWKWEYRLWIFFKTYLYNAMIIKLSSCQDDHHLLLTENVSLWFPRALSAQQLLTCSFVSQECCINMLNLETLIAGNDLQRFENPNWYHCLKFSAFIFASSGGVLMVRDIVDPEVVGSNPIHGKWAEVFHILFEFKIRVIVLRWLVVVGDGTGTRV